MLHHIAFLALISYITLAASIVQAQVTLDFENLGNPNIIRGLGNFQGHSIIQNGFTITDTSNIFGLFSVAPNGGNFGGNYTGSVALANSAGGGITALTQNDGDSFPINSIDIANIFLQTKVSGGVTVIFTGKKQGGEIVTKTITHGANDTLETVTFDNSFTNLASISLDQEGRGPNSQGNQFDNIVLRTSSVPEPGNVALLIVAGLSGAGFFVRRRR